MSRSRKKSYYSTDHKVKVTRKKKRIASKKVRRDKDFSTNGAAYKKKYESWDICDYRCRWTKEKAIESWYEEESDHFHGYPWRHKEFGTLERWLSYWAKCVYRK